MKTLKGQVALVTGASSGIGRAIALELAEYGTEVCVAARRVDELHAVAREVCRRGAQAHICRADLTRDEDLQRLADVIQENFGKLDILVLCGGAMVHASLQQASLDDFDLQYRCNVRGHYALAQLMLPFLREARGQIVFVNSSTGLRSPATVGQFSATQHALRAVANSLRDEVNPDGIRVLSVYPGRTATPRIQALFEKEGRPYRPELLIQPEDVAAMVAHALTLPHSAEVTDIRMRPMQKSY
jgi:NADP-dependent 3-hydroxy acid dehydrogenase YdfG